MKTKFTFSKRPINRQLESLINKKVGKNEISHLKKEAICELWRKLKIAPCITLCQQFSESNQSLIL